MQDPNQRHQTGMHRADAKEIIRGDTGGVPRVDATRHEVRKARWRRAARAFSSSLILVTLSTVPALSAELRLTIKGVRSDSGEILVALYDSADGFRSAIANAAKRGLLPDSGRLIGTAIRAKRGSQSTVFTQLPPGRYAVIVIHDENDNGRLDENAMGAPTEGYGFGNNARGFLSAPSFEAASITVGDADVSTSITLVYPKAPYSTR
ncbi:MAG TPA: DUF2141 domain-containing protein [Stellaceae bacterium]|nr:DUF2141 domain-containing protein [Stellaceae bacterium]